MTEINPSQVVKTQSRFPFWLLLWPLAISLRMTNFYGVFVDGKVFLSSTDPYHHLRRILLTLDNFPHVPDFDLYLNFPIGASTHWPFGFDILMAAIISFLTLGQADRWWIEAIAALLPAFIGGLLPLVIYLILVKTTDQFTAIFGGLMMMILPPAVFFSQIGNLDHHFLAALFQGLFFLTYLKASQEKKSFWLIIASVLLMLGFTSTTEFPFVVAIHCIYLFVLWFTLSIERQNELILVNLKIFLSTSILLLPFVFTRYFEPNGVSPLLGSSWLGCFAFAIFLTILATGKKLIPFWITAIILLLGAICLIKFDFSLIRLLLAEANQSQGNNILGSSIRENRSLIFDGIGYLLYWHSAFLLLVPAMLFLLIRRRSEVNLLILVSLFIMQSLSLAHMRLSVLLPVPLVLASAFLVKEAFILAKNYFSKHYLAESLTLVSAFFLLLPCMSTINFPTSVIVISHKPFLPLYESFTWLKEHSPRIEPSKPSYGILSNEWDLGHWLVHFAERPTVSSPLLHTSDLAQAVFAATKIFVEPPEQALKSMEARKLKYIFFTPDDFLYLIEVAGVTPPKEGENYDSLYGRLLASYGFPQGKVTHPALNRIRLVYEGEKLDGDPPLPSSMIFEVVKGANLQGQVTPNSTLTVSTQIKVGKRRIPYAMSTQADENGRFSFTVPYSTSLNSSTNVIASPYIIKFDKLLTSIKVETEQVREGKIIEVKFSTSN